jgi:hypothetical protein
MHIFRQSGGSPPSLCDVTPSTLIAAVYRPMCHPQDEVFDFTGVRT